jgi:hypothetical protein
LPLLNRYRSTAERSYYKALSRLQTDLKEARRAEDKAIDTYVKNVVYAPLPREPQSFDQLEAYLASKLQPQNGFFRTRSRGCAQSDICRLRFPLRTTGTEFGRGPDPNPELAEAPDMMSDNALLLRLA